MKNIFKGLGLGLVALALCVGVTAFAATTFVANSITEDGALTLSSSDNTAAVTLGTATQTSGVTKVYGGTATGTGTSAGLSLTPGTAGTVFIGSTTGTGAITVGASTGLGETVNIGSGATTGSDVVNIGTGTATTMKTVNIGAVGSVVAPSTVHISDTSDTASTQVVSVGSAGKSANTLTFEAGTGATAIQIGNGATAHGIQIGTGAAVNTVVLGSTNTTSATTINYGTGALKLSPTSPPATTSLATNQFAMIRTVASAGGAAAEAYTVAGLRATAVVACSIDTAGTNGSVYIIKTIPTSGTLTATFSGDPGTGAVLGCMIHNI